MPFCNAKWPGGHKARPYSDRTPEKFPQVSYFFISPLAIRKPMVYNMCILILNILGRKPEMRYGFGVDLGGTTVKIAYFDENGTMLRLVQRQ